MRLHGFLIALLIASGGCADGTPDPGGAAERASRPPEVSVDGAITTVMNRGTDAPAASVVEEVSIGVAAGDEAYLLGGVSAIAASDDRIYVADFQTVNVRAYDAHGEHLFDIGGQGAGPGEFRRPWAIGVTPDDRLVVRDQLQRRTHVFDLDGRLIADWPSERGIRSTVGRDGALYVMREDIFPNADGMVTAQVIDYDPDGTPGTWRRFPDHAPTPAADYPIDDPEGPPPQMRGRIELMAVFLGIGGDWRSTRWVPFAPRVVVEVDDDGALVSGRADAYRFRVQRDDGSELVVQKEWTPIPVQPDEADWYRRRLTALWRAATDESWQWLGPDVPAFKPAYTAIVPTRDASYWVIREMAGAPLQDCDESPADFFAFDSSPCWRQPYVADVFDADGRFVRSVAMPEGVRYHVRPYIDGDELVVLVEDAEGVARVRQLRVASAQ